MARKHARNAGWLIPQAIRPAVSRYLPASILPLFLPSKVREAATGRHIDRDRRDEAHGVFRAWAAKLRLGQLHGLNETSVHADFTNILLKALGYVSPGGSTTEFTMYPEWHVPGIGHTDVALGRFRFDQEGKVQGTPIVLGELKGAGTDLDKAA